MGAANGIHTAEFENTVVVRLVGGHDLATAPALQGVVEEYARPGARLVFDLSPATFIDSSVIHAVIDAAANADRASVVAPPGSATRRLIHLTNVEAVADVFESTEQALAHAIDQDDAAVLARLADDLLDAAWESGEHIDEALALARKMSRAIGREPLIEDAKILIANAKQCTPSEAFQLLVEQSQRRNQRLAALARDLTRAAQRNDPSSADAFAAEMHGAVEARLQ